MSQATCPAILFLLSEILSVYHSEESSDEGSRPFIKDRSYPFHRLKAGLRSG